MGVLLPQLLLNSARTLLVLCATDLRPLLINGFFKPMEYLVLGGLLAFVVLHSSHIRNLVAGVLRALPGAPLRFRLGRQWVTHSEIVVVPNEACRACPFQRPPPFLSL